MQKGTKGAAAGPQTENMDTTSVYTGNNKWLVPYIK
jgi:hypothetical protein